MSRTNKKQDVSSQRGIFQTIKLWLDRTRLGELLVTKGHINARDLRHILLIQKQTGKPLGQVVVAENYISKNQLRFMLGRQHVLRSVATCLLFLATIGAISAKKVRADSIKDVIEQISIAKPASARNFEALRAYPALFESHEKRSNNLKPFTKWSGMFDRFEREMQNAGNYALMQDWKDEISTAQGLSLKEKARKINAIVNEKRYIVDNKNWGKSDYWATPVEFLKRGGDCEDFAIAKYTALRALGVPEDRLRVAIVHDNHKNIPHAVLVVYTSEGPYILDNQIKTLVDGDRAGRYRPIFSINRQAWWLHTETDPTTVIASAQ